MICITSTNLQDISCFTIAYHFSLVSLISAEYCLPMVRVGGLFLAAKGHDPLVRSLSINILNVYALVVLLLRLHAVRYHH